MTYRITAVCLGNICRSPMAEAVIRARAREAGLGDTVVVDSAGTGRWHVGQGADPRALRALHRRGYTLDHTVRQFHPDWTSDDHPLRPDLVLAMDTANHRELLRLGVPPDTLRMMRAFDPAYVSGIPPDVPDPYDGGDGDFNDVLDMLENAASGLILSLTAPTRRQP